MKIKHIAFTMGTDHILREVLPLCPMLIVSHRTRLILPYTLSFFKIKIEKIKTDSPFLPPSPFGL